MNSPTTTAPRGQRILLSSLLVVAGALVAAVSVAIPIGFGAGLLYAVACIGLAISGGTRVIPAWVFTVVIAALLLAASVGMTNVLLLTPA